MAQEPMTPSDCDLRGLPFMPLDVARLRDSDLALVSTGDEFKAAVLLWCAAWAQVPAASLPNDDRLLARLLGLDAKAWKKVRGEALRGWELCSDGRLYHAVVAEKARDAWKDRQSFREKRERDAERLRNWRSEQRERQLLLEHFRNDCETDIETPDETRFETHEKGTGTGTGITREGSSDPPLATGKPARAAPKGSKRAIPDGYPDEPALAEARALVAQAGVLVDVADQARRFRSHALAQARRAANWPAAWTGWIENIIAEAPKAAPVPDRPITQPWTGPPDIRAAVVSAMGEPWAVGYLDRCGWRDIPKAVIAPNDFMAGRIRREVGDVLRSLGVSIEISERGAA